MATMAGKSASRASRISRSELKAWGELAASMACGGIPPGWGAPPIWIGDGCRGRTVCVIPWESPIAVGVDTRPDALAGAGAQAGARSYGEAHLPRGRVVPARKRLEAGWRD